LVQINFAQKLLQRVNPPSGYIAGHSFSLRSKCSKNFFNKFLKETEGYEVPQRRMNFLQEKIRHMGRWANLPKGHLSHLHPIAGELVSNRYRRFGYGRKSVLGDLLVNLDG
jgi:hypothetical protein